MDTIWDRPGNKSTVAQGMAMGIQAQIFYLPFYYAIESLEFMSFRGVCPGRCRQVLAYALLYDPYVTKAATAA